MVRLQLFGVEATVTVTETVSIPLWFDYNFNPLFGLHGGGMRLNSTMVRLQLLIFSSTNLQSEKSQFHYGSITTLFQKKRR